MEFDLIIANPPYGSLGNPIISEAIKHLADNGTASVLMPLSCYKKNELYRHVDTFELANPKLFKDAVITENLCITTCKKNTIDNYSLIDLVLASCDQRYIEYYKWNIEHNKGYITKRADYKKAGYFQRDVDFLESSRCYASAGGGGFGKGGFGWKYNNTLDEVDINAKVVQIRMDSAISKKNMSIWWYSAKKGVGLASKMALGVHTAEASSVYSFSIPQIDWEHISDTNLWKAGNYDDAVLSEMGLKMENGVIVKC